MNINFEQLRLNATLPNKFALGYPVNREHAFAINYDILGIREDSFSSTYLNNIASPYYHGSYTRDNVKDLEVELMRQLAQHFNLKDEFGYVTYGGTEANFTSLWWHRKYLTNKFNVKPILVCSSNSHYSLKKIADQLDISIKFIEADHSGIDYESLEGFLSENTHPIIYCVNFGTTVSGAIEDVVRIKTLLDTYANNKYKIHGDGAIYGLLLPYIFKNISSIFDYVATLSFSGHKFLGSFNISGVVLTTTQYLEEVFYQQNVNVHYVQNAIDVTSSGSRQGFFVLELYLLIKEALHKSNLENLWNECVARAEFFTAEISKIFYPHNELLHYNKGQLSVLIPAPVEEKLRLNLGRKYGLMPVNDNQFGIYVFPRSTMLKLKQFLQEYKQIMEKANFNVIR